MNPHFVRNEVDALKGMITLWLSSNLLTQRDYNEFCSRLERISCCWECCYKLNNVLMQLEHDVKTFKKGVDDEG
jgi:hypothetical protein